MQIKLMIIEDLTFSKAEIEILINSCSWPSQFCNIVHEGTWDYKDALEYFQRIDSSKCFIKDAEAVSYMTAALTLDGWMYFLSRFMIYSMDALESELTEVLLNFLCKKFPSNNNYKKHLTKKQSKSITNYLKYMYSKTKNTEISDSLLLDWNP